MPVSVEPPRRSTVHSSELRGYTARLADRRARVAALDAVHDRLALARGLVFAAGAIVAWRAFVSGVLHPGWVVPPALAFAALVVWHARSLAARERAARAVAFYERGLARLDGTWTAAAHAASLSDGTAFVPADHPFAEDLDLFGPGSLFALLATPRTHGGEARLASWLLTPSAPDVVRARQAAVADLAPRLDLREDLAVLGPSLRVGVDPAALVRWAEMPPVMGPAVVAGLLTTIALATVGQIAWWIYSGEPPRLLGVTLVAHAIVGLLFRSRVLAVNRDVEERAHDLQLLAAILERVERESFTAPHLGAQVERLRASGHDPVAEVRALSLMADLLASRHSPFFGPISTLLFWASHLAFAVERWRRRVGPAVAGWLNALSELEALSALAGYAAEHPDDPFPVLTGDAGHAEVRATALAHPLLPIETAVPNDIALGGSSPALLLVSGSNMAGKSTLLRALGMNVVLAQAGAPVRASSMTLTPLAVGATLRIQDSLQAGRSRFFAEITRLQQVVALARASNLPETPQHPSAPFGTVQAPFSTLQHLSAPFKHPSAPCSTFQHPSAPLSTFQHPSAPFHVLFLLDELLAGTNSHDRRHGAEAILRGLLDLGAIGLATTHDLALTQLADALAPRAANVHLEDQFVDGQLHFDYRLRPGVVQGSNALALMRSVGLDV